MSYVRTEPTADPMDKVVNVTLWSGDRYLNGVRLAFRAADRLASNWTRGRARCSAPRFAYIEDASRVLKYTPTGLVIAMEAA